MRSQIDADFEFFRWLSVSCPSRCLWVAYLSVWERTHIYSHGYPSPLIHDPDPLTQIGPTSMIYTQSRRIKGPKSVLGNMPEMSK